MFGFGYREHFLDKGRRHIHGHGNAFTSYFTIEEKYTVFCSPTNVGEASVLKTLRLPVSESACLCSEDTWGIQCKWAEQRRQLGVDSASSLLPAPLQLQSCGSFFPLSSAWRCSVYQHEFAFREPLCMAYDTELGLKKARDSFSTKENPVNASFRPTFTVRLYTRWKN